MALFTSTSTHVLWIDKEFLHPMLSTFEKKAKYDRNYQCTMVEGSEK